MCLNNPQSFDELAVGYEAAIPRVARSHDFFLSHLPEQHGSALDVGCGTGSLAYELSQHFDSVLALDLSEPMLAIARKKRSAANIEYRQVDANALGLTGPFDIIVSHLAFHHLASIPDTLSALKAALAPGGRLIIVDRIGGWLDRILLRWKLGCFALAGLLFVFDCVRRGFSAAWTLFRFNTSQKWIAHVKGDRYLTPDQFHNVYGPELPGARFTRMGCLMGIVWTAPNTDKTS